MSRRKRIEAEADHILKQYGSVGSPVDPVQLTSRMGLRVFNAKFEDPAVHGLIARRPAATTIYVNAEDKPVRKRFTVAHELGHFVLHLASGEGEFIDNEDNFRTVLDFDQPWDDTRVAEWEANVFASALLMPEELVRSRWEELGDIDSMADWFQVSKQAMAIRLAHLHLVE